MHLARTGAARRRSSPLPRRHPPPPAARSPLCNPLLPQGFTVTSVPTAPIAGQKTGTSGLRKKTKEFMSDNYLANW